MARAHACRIQTVVRRRPASLRATLERFIRMRRGAPGRTQTETHTVVRNQNLGLPSGLRSTVCLIFGLGRMRNQPLIWAVARGSYGPTTCTRASNLIC